MAPSTKPRHTNSTPPSIAPHPTSIPNLVPTTSISSSPTLQSTLNAPRPPVKRLVPSDTLGRYLTSEDRRDRSFMAILAAFSTVVRQPVNCWWLELTYCLCFCVAIPAPQDNQGMRASIIVLIEANMPPSWPA